MKTCSLCLMCSALVLATFTPTSAQTRVTPLDEIEIPRLALPQDMGVIWNMSSSGFSRSVQTSVENGVKKTHATENGLKAYIEEDPENGILIKITKQYGPDEIESLVDEQPELYMHLKALPTEVGDSEIEITVGVTTKYEADDADDLKERHPEAFEVYEKFTKANGVTQFGGTGRLEGFPRLRVPRDLQRGGFRFDIDPRGIRIHDRDDEKDEAEKQDQQKKAEKKKDKDA